MTEGKVTEAAWPTDTYFDEFHKLPEYFNGEAVILYSAPKANTDGDTLVYFRHSEVISAGAGTAHAITTRRSGSRSATAIIAAHASPCRY